jgi:hypothetical protein
MSRKSFWAMGAAITILAFLAAGARPQPQPAEMPAEALQKRLQSLEESLQRAAESLARTHDEQTLFRRRVQPHRQQAGARVATGGVSLPGEAFEPAPTAKVIKASPQFSTANPETAAKSVSADTTAQRPSVRKTYRAARHELNSWRRAPDWCEQA